jgi:hypothetical protein
MLALVLSGQFRWSVSSGFRSASLHAQANRCLFTLCIATLPCGVSAPAHMGT